MRPQAANPGFVEMFRQRIQLWQQGRRLTRELRGDNLELSSNLGERVTRRSFASYFQIVFFLLGSAMLIFAGIWAIQIYFREPAPPVDQLIPVLDTQSLAASNNAATGTAATTTHTDTATIDSVSTAAAASVGTVSDTALSTRVTPGAGVVESDTLAVAEPEIIRVHIVGAVQNPGVVSLYEGNRVLDALEAAGGRSSSADLERVNLAAVVSDGDWVWIPKHGQAQAPNIAPISSSAPVTSKATSAQAVAQRPVNINTASSAELESLSGVGPATAAAIIETRERRGPFRNVDELVEVSGIGPGRLERLRPNIVTGP